MTTAKELRELNLEDLNRRSVELRETLFQDAMKLKTGTLDSPAERAKHRKELARVLTVLTQKHAVPGATPDVAKPAPKAEAKAAAPKAKPAEKVAKAPKTEKPEKAAPAAKKKAAGKSAEKA